MEQQAEFRKARLKELADLVGKTELAHALGHVDGSYIGQMLSGRRPISEKFIAQIANKLPRFANWFVVGAASTHIAFPADTREQAAAYDLDPTSAAKRHIVQLGRILESVDPIRRKAIAGLLGDLGMQPSEAEAIAGHVASLLASSPAKKSA